MDNPFLIGDPIIARVLKGWQAPPRPPTILQAKRYLIIDLIKSSKGKQVYLLMDDNGKVSIAPYHYILDRFELDVIS